MSGMVLGIHFPTPNTMVCLDNLKFKTRAIDYCRANKKAFEKDNPKINLEEILTRWENTRRTPPHFCVPQPIWNWILPRWQREGIDPKKDHHGLPAGKIDQHWIDKFSKDYFDYAMAAEFVEETERVIVREIRNSNGELVERVSLFKRLALLRCKNRETGDYDFEHYFFHILEADGQWGQKGFPGETEPPEIVQITSLFPPDYRNREGKWPDGGIDLYPKHGFGVKLCLRELVHNQHREEYLPALTHVEKFFPREAKDVGLIEELEADPTLDLNDEKAWQRFIEREKNNIKRIDDEK